MIDELKDIHQSHERSTEDEINVVKNNQKKGKECIDWTGWTSEVEWPSPKKADEKEENGQDEDKGDQEEDDHE
ncbi:hypothetical protein G6F70_006252 [Rhizopus microsporus]|nr:hypothetical protein G6F71_006170 [Rhizopus microsporus]KAG1197901.1 hypothetical protein G6F70_006252 [Rhizopus microsporus]KAG1209668.1 hypothetical protein G6F69_006149 [Rhizopus microsporus]KAG1231180.1 hypothetical protein G6F67_005931 [Rhizopus microsporus]KAG1258858.1 hypothetical protein G6F68_008511 [Rhizopus microsporus]